MKKFEFKKIYAACIMALVGIIALVACRWYGQHYCAGFEEILVTVTSPLKGTDTTAIKDGFATCVPPVALLFGLFVLPAVLWYRIGAKKAHSKTKTIADNLFVAAGCVILLSGLLYVDRHFGISDYAIAKTQQTDVYQKYYVDPDDISITNSGTKKNLILLYVESLETSYASFEEGGGQDINYIPQLTQLAKEEVNFTDDGLLGGFHNTMGSSWTAGALFSSTAAVPYPTGTAVNVQADSFALGVTGLYDILARDGYSQYYMCGSDAYFGGRSSYYQSHGDLTIYDLNTAKKEGFIGEDYHVWWGMEDTKLYSYAKEKILAAAEKEEPFSFTMLTVDTHFPSGYICAECGDSYPTVAENVVSCADRQATEFVNWCRQQDFFEDTIIVVTGDHPRMDKPMPKDTPSYQRTCYAVFVNCDDKTADSKNRLYTQLDMLPTTLGAMGYDIEGDCIGLGVNLFSGKETLAEQLGFDTLNAELTKSSDFLNGMFKKEGLFDKADSLFKEE